MHRLYCAQQLQVACLQGAEPRPPTVVRPVYQVHCMLIFYSAYIQVYSSSRTEPHASSHIVLNRAQSGTRYRLCALTVQRVLSRPPVPPDGSGRKFPAAAHAIRRRRSPGPISVSTHDRPSIPCQAARRRPNDTQYTRRTRLRYPYGRLCTELRYGRRTSPPRPAPVRLASTRAGHARTTATYLSAQRTSASREAMVQ